MDRPTQRELESYRHHGLGKLFGAVMSVLIANDVLDGALDYVNAASTRIRIQPELVVPLADALVKAGRTPEAVELVQRDFGKSDWDDLEAYAFDLSKLAHSMIEAGDGNLAKPVLAKAEEILGDSRYPATRSRRISWIDLAETWALLGHNDKAREAADRAAKDMATAGHHQFAGDLAARYSEIGEEGLAARVHGLSAALQWISVALDLERKREIQQLDDKIHVVAQGDPQKVPEGLATIASDMGQALTLVIRQEKEGEVN